MAVVGVAADSSGIFSVPVLRPNSLLSDLFETLDNTSFDRNCILFFLAQVKQPLVKIRDCVYYALTWVLIVAVGHSCSLPL
jgi:hypothetical protein